MIYVTFSVSVQEGYADAIGSLRKTLDRGVLMEAVPRVGDTVEVGWGHNTVKWVDWDPFSKGMPVFVRLSDLFTCGDPFPKVVGALTEMGWG